MPKMKTLTIGGVTFEVSDPEAVQITQQDLPEEQQEQARENIGASAKKPAIADIAVTEAADGSVTMVNTLVGGGTETLVISPDANGNPSKLTYNGTEIPITWTEATATEGTEVTA